MAVDERRRSQLFQAAAGALGEEPAMTMFELLPPDGAELGTRQDLRETEHRLESRIDQLDTQLTGRIDQLEVRMDALREELLAAFRGELVSAVSGQTRAVIVATATAVFGLGGLAVSLAQLL